MAKICLLVIGFFCASFVAVGQAANHVVQPIEWTSFNLAVSFSKKLGLVNDGNFRFEGKLQSMQHQLRSGLEYTLSPKWSVVPIGYSYIFNYRYGEQPAAFVNNEFRFWHQIQYKEKFGRLAIGQRLRFEERNIQRHHKSESGDIMSDGYSNDQYRFRYRVNATLPLNKIDHEKYWYLNVWDELHYSWGKYVKYRTPSQNRLFVGAGYQFSKRTSFQGGAFYQWMKKDNGYQTENNIGVLLQFNYAISLYKPKPAN